MASVIGLVLLLTICLSSMSIARPSTDPVIEGTDLIFAFMTHRHGDRTPVASSLDVIGNSVDRTIVMQLIDQYGYGQLTDPGKRSGYKCGQFIRRRYNDLIAPKYNKSELYIRTTDSTRVQMTTLTAMSALFPTGYDNWSKWINWAPVTYTTVPAKYDFNTPTVNCPKFITAYYRAYLSNEKRLAPYAALIEKISRITGYDITSYPMLVAIVYDVFVSLKSLGYELSDDIKDLMEEITEAAGVSWDINAGNDQYLHLQAGPFLNEFFKYANATIAGTDTQKVRIYGGHDLNIYSLEAITRVTPRQGAPKYASLYSLELRRVIETGQFVVLPVYLADPHEGKEIYLQVEGCKGEYLCDYFEFLNITSQHVQDEATWRTECGFSNDLVVDTSSID